MRARRRETERIALLAIIVLGTALRLITLGDRTLWGDELYALDAAIKPLGEIVGPGFIDNGNMLLFYIVAHAWVTLFPAAAPIDEAALRALPLLFSVATIPVVHALARRVAANLRLRSPYQLVFPLLATTLFALSPFSVQYAQEFRAYSLQLLLIALASLTALRASDGDAGSRWWLLYGTLVALALYAHMLAAIFFAAQIASLGTAALVAKRHALVRDLVKGAAWSVLLLTPLAATVALVGGSQIDWIQPLAPERIAATVGVLAGASAKVMTPATGLSLAIALIAPVVGTALIATRWRTSPPTIAIAFAPLVLVPLTFLAFSAAITSIWVTRYFHALLLPMILATSVGALALLDAAVRALRSGSVAFATIGALALVATMAMPLAGLRATLARTPEQDWREPIATIERACPDGTRRALVGPQWTYPALRQVIAGYGLRVDQLVDDPTAIEMPTNQPLCIIVYRFVARSSALDTTIARFTSRLGAPTRYPPTDGYAAIYRFDAPAE